MERNIVPYICYQGESSAAKGFYPAKERYVIWIRIYKLLGKLRNDCYLAYTDKDGKLHPLGDDYLNPTINKVTINKTAGGPAYTVHNFKPWSLVKKDNSVTYNIPVKVGAGEEIAMFFAPRELLYFALSGGSSYNQIHVSTVQKRGILRTWQVLRGKDAVPNFKKTDKYWAALPCDYDLYLARMRWVIKEMNKRLKASRNRLGKLMAMSAVVDQAANLIAARGRSAYMSWYLKLATKKQYSTISLHTIETLLLKKHVIKPMQRHLRNLFKNSSAYAQRRLNTMANELVRILESPVHHQTFERRFKSDFKSKKNIRRDVRESYMHAYSLLSRTKKGPALYKAHFGPLLNKCTAKNKNQIAKGIDAAASKAGWVRSLRGEMFAVVEAYGTLTLSNQLTNMRTELMKAARFLEDRGLAKTGDAIDTLEQKLNQSILYNQRVDASDYFQLPKSDIGWKAFNGIVSGLKLASVMTKKHQDLADKIDSANTVVGVGIEISQINAIKNQVPASAVIGKAGGVITAATDWGLSIHKMNKSADKGEGTEFALSVTSYCGKGLVLGGTVLMLTPFAPLGLALVAVGGAVDIIGGAVGFVVNYKSADLQKFENTFKKLKKLDSRREIYIFYEVACREKAKNTDYAKWLVKQDRGFQVAMNKEWTSTFGSPYKVSEIIESYFNNHYFGLINTLKDM
ncbi:MAG: hypothetical protein JW860_16510 [Sedimentisphaerales bacterium]|nr:hypothetical protein [Sedimentisphaerales bacterium]